MLHHLIIGPVPCIFEVLKDRLFLESVCVGKQELGLVSDPTLKGHEIPPLPPYIDPLGRRLDFGFCLDQKFAIAATSRTSFVSNDQTKTSQNPTLINKAFILYSQYPNCNLSFLLVLHLLTGNRPSWSG